MFVFSWDPILKVEDSLKSLKLQQHRSKPQRFTPFGIFGHENRGSPFHFTISPGDSRDSPTNGSPQETGSPTRSPSGSSIRWVVGSKKPLRVQLHGRRVKVHSVPSRPVPPRPGVAGRFAGGVFKGRRRRETIWMIFLLPRSDMLVPGEHPPGGTPTSCHGESRVSTPTQRQCHMDGAFFVRIAA